MLFFFVILFCLFAFLIINIINTKQNKNCSKLIKNLRYIYYIKIHESSFKGRVFKFKLKCTSTKNNFKPHIISNLSSEFYPLFEVVNRWSSGHPNPSHIIKFSLNYKTVKKSVKNKKCPLIFSSNLAFCICSLKNI